MKKRPGIYRIVHRVSGRVYIGSSQHVPKRLWAHRWALRHNSHHSPFLQHAFNKYGEGAFDFVMIEDCTIEALLEREQVHISISQSFDPAHGYNIAAVAGTRRGVLHSKSTLEAMRKSKTGISLSPEHCAAISAGKRGSRLSPAHRLAVSAGVKRAWSDAENRDKFIKSFKGRPPRPCKPVKPKIRAPIRARISVRRKFSAEQVAAIRAAKAQGLTYSALEVMFSTSRGSLQNVLGGKLYKDKS